MENKSSKHCPNCVHKVACQCTLYSVPPDSFFDIRNFDSEVENRIELHRLAVDKQRTPTNNHITLGGFKVWWCSV